VTRSTSQTLFVIATLSFAGSHLGCSGPPIPSTIKGEPICADYSIGASGDKLRGGLRYPVRMTILDDDDPVSKVFIYGKRTEDGPSPKTSLPDKDAEYKVEWAQCVNERATVAVNAPKAKSLRADSSTAYDCGEAQVYKTATLVTKKGDPASHVLTFEAPPKPDCWKDAKPDEAADAGTPDAAQATDAADAGAADADVADADVADANVADASAADADADVADATGADAAPAKGSGDKSADKPEEKKGEK